MHFGLGVPDRSSILGIDEILLAVRHFAHRATVLRRHPNRIIGLFDHTRFVNQRNTILFAHLPLVNVNHGLRFPRTLTHKVLHAPHFLAQTQRHLFNILARGIAQQAMHVGSASLDLLYSLNGRLEQLHILLQFLGKSFNIFPAQIALWCRQVSVTILVGMAFFVSFPLSVSHSDELALYAVAWNHRLGIDLEKNIPTVEYEAIAENYFPIHKKKMFQSSAKDKRFKVFLIY